MTARPMTEVEQITFWKKTLASEQRKHRETRRKLYLTSAAERGMREALKEIAGHNGVLGATYREQAHLMRDIAIAALSLIEGEDEQARGQGRSAPISTDTKGTTK